MISVVVPVFNEHDVLPRFLARLRPAMEECSEPHEVLFVDDGSTDDTAEQIVAASAAWAELSVVRLRRNAGHQAALTAGLAEARGDWVVTIDADLQDPPELIPEMLKTARLQGVDVVYALRSDRASDSWFKRTSARVYYRVMRRIADTDLPAHAGDFRLMSRAVVDDLNALPERHRVYRLLVPYLGFPSAVLTYQRAARAAGESKYPVGRMVRLAVDSATSFSAAPLRIATWMGLLGSLVSLVLGVGAVVAWAAGATVPGWTSVMVAVFFVGAVQLLSLGLLGEYLGRVYSELQGRPRYLLRDTRNSTPPGDRSTS